MTPDCLTRGQSSIKIFKRHTKICNMRDLHAILQSAARNIFMWLPGQRAARLALELAWGAACGFALLYHKKEAEKERSKFPTAFPRLPPPVTATSNVTPTLNIIQRDSPFGAASAAAAAATAPAASTRVATAACTERRCSGCCSDYRGGPTKVTVVQR